MIYDCFTFFNELDLLEIRLNILAPKVDKFIILEADHTFSGKYKGFNLKEHLDDRFKDFPIEYYEINFDGEDPSHSDHERLTWAREHDQRIYLKNCIEPKDDDIVIVSDLDEIPDPDYIDGHSTGRFHPRLYYFYLNLHAATFFNGPYMITGNYSRVMNYQDLRRHAPVPDLMNVGWHFSSMGGIERVMTKLESFAHIEFDNDEMKDKVTEYHASLRDIHGAPLNIVEIDETYPEYIQDNWESKYPHLVWQPSIS